jgi:hypothetical protein
MLVDDLDHLIEEATVDTYDEYEQSAGFLAVEKMGQQYLVDILDVNIDTHKINGGKWLAAYQKWRKDV